MNTNSTNNQNHNKKEKKPFKIDEKTLSTILYVGAAVLVVVVLTVSIFAFASRNKKPETPVTSSTQSAVTTTPVTTTEMPPVTTAPTTTGNNVTNVDKPTVATPVYVTPVEGEVSKVHDSETLVYSVTMNDYRVHLGIDVEAPVGTPVYAVADGTVKSVYQDYLMGTCLAIEHAGGIVSYYKNLNEALPEGIKEGATVTSGQMVGGVGESAIIEQCDEAHLHFEMTKDGKSVNPLDYISYGKNTETVEK